MSSTGLSPDPQEYRQRLEEQTDDQIDAWAAELMRDLSIRVGVRHVLRGLMRATALDDRGLERIYAAGGGPPAAVGRTADGEIMVPAISLHCFIAGLRRSVPDSRDRLTRYLVDHFHDIVYV